MMIFKMEVFIMSLELQTLECLRHRLNDLRSRSLADAVQIAGAADSRDRAG